MNSDPIRCAWCLAHDDVRHYHDAEWGVPLHEDRGHFEHLALETAQAGLSWRTVLRKRARYREVFEEFDPERVTAMGPSDVERLLGDAGIIRNRAKIEATIHNARPFLAIQEEFGSFSQWIWAFVDGKPLQAERRSASDVPPRTDLSDRVSLALKKRGFKFVGSTVIYAHLQATGLVNDHEVACFRRVMATGARAEVWL